MSLRCGAIEIVIFCQRCHTHTYLAQARRKDKQKINSIADDDCNCDDYDQQYCQTHEIKRALQSTMPGYSIYDFSEMPRQGM